MGILKSLWASGTLSLSSEVERVSSCAMTELGRHGGAGVHLDDGQTRERQYLYSTVHNSAGHGGQGERRREDEGRMGGMQGVGSRTTQIHWYDRLECKCECVSVCDRLCVRCWTLVVCEASEANA